LIDVKNVFERLALIGSVNAEVSAIHCRKEHFEVSIFGCHPSLPSLFFAGALDINPSRSTDFICVD
jgi:hypothetical protein